MISPSESAGKRRASVGVAGGMPVRLLGEGVRGVSRLEFYPVEQPEVTEQPEQKDETPALLKEEAPELDAQLRTETERMSREIEEARSEMKAEARREWEKELEERIVEERSAILTTCDEFRRERTKYFAQVEAEVVKLALAIAARVLHREINLDPLLLTGVVRVALEKVAEDSAAVLRVHASAVAKWREVLAEGVGPSLQIVGDERLRAGECVLETNVGSVELGVSAQLAEIERGFFDLMQQRPA
jgi:flagellar assembly protein FliH